MNQNNKQANDQCTVPPYAIFKVRTSTRFTDDHPLTMEPMAVPKRR